MDKTKAEPIQILLIEDDPGDRKLVSRFFEKAKVTNQINKVKDGEEALDYLHQRGEFEDSDDAPAPDLILLDLNLPRIDGREVLEKMKSNEDLREIPVIVLTTSEEDEDVHRSYDLGASSYIVKPVDMAQFSDVVQAIENYWFQVVKLPS